MDDELADDSGSDAAPMFRCSFCGKTREEVRKLIAGPQVFICDECVGLCVEILQADEDSPPQT